MLHPNISPKFGILIQSATGYFIEEINSIKISLISLVASLWICGFYYES